MNFRRQLQQTGTISTAVKQGRREKPKNADEIKAQQKLIDICLNCPYSKCKPRCRFFPKKRKEIKNG